MYQIKNNCEACEFRVEQINVIGELTNMCIMKNKQVALLEKCEEFSQNTGKHYTA